MNPRRRPSCELCGRSRAELRGVRFFARVGRDDRMHTICELCLYATRPLFCARCGSRWLGDLGRPACPDCGRRGEVDLRQLALPGIIA